MDLRALGIIVEVAAARQEHRGRHIEEVVVMALQEEGNETSRCTLLIMPTSEESALREKQLSKVQEESFEFQPLAECCMGVGS